ncbi:hypothetical protein V7O62_13775 [Methanolobus sp. ZRKC2]|uniref:hypothetical protein n=1 Tax=Methanolobus sp. ZRKC2 TaxID=3125783 RepID=UPI0032562712
MGQYQMDNEQKCPDIHYLISKPLSLPRTSGRWLYFTVTGLFAKNCSVYASVQTRNKCYGSKVHAIDEHNRL